MSFIRAFFNPGRFTQPTRQDLWFLPLGGSGEIGLNLNLYGHAGQWLMVDCGIGFEARVEPSAKETGHKVHQAHQAKQGGGLGVLVANTEFIEQHIERLAGIVITHAHEDHLGAIVYLWQTLRVPIYATRFAAGVLRRKLALMGVLEQVNIIEVRSAQAISIGAFSVEWLAVTHSVPESNSVLIRTPVGAVLHTGDWKLDAQPLLGKAFDVERFKTLPGLAAMVCDSTNALKPGFSVSESVCQEGLYQTILAAPQRVVVTCFSSNIARLITLAKVAKQTGRHVALLGRSLETMVQIAKSCGYWPENLPLLRMSELDYLPKHQVMVLATGSQAEPGAALTKLSYGAHSRLVLEPEDQVIFSAIMIPDNQPAIMQMVHRLSVMKVKVIQSETSVFPIHATGHPNQGDLTQLYQWAKPDLVIPVHGERDHLHANAQVAQAAGVPNVLQGVNGDLFKIRPFAKKLAQHVAVGVCRVEPVPIVHPTRRH
jgi:ribonuclease J